MSWYSKPSSKWWQESSEKEWREKGSQGPQRSKVWTEQKSESHETWNGHNGHSGQNGNSGQNGHNGISKKDERKASEWAQSKTKGDWSQQEWSEWSKSKGDWKSQEWEKSKDSKGEWRSDWKTNWKPGDKERSERSERTEKADRAQRQQWVAKSEKPRPEADKPPPQVDPAVALEAALADVEELLGERLESTRDMLELSDRNSREAVRLVTLALELLTKQTSESKDEQDLNNVTRAKKSVRELLMWRNFGLKMWLHNKPDPMNFQTYDAEVQNDLRHTWTKIEQKLMQELIAGDSWSKLARKLRFCVGNKEFSVEMRQLLTRIINTCELADCKQKGKSVEDLTETEHALFGEMAADDSFGDEVIRAVRTDRLRQQEANIYPAYDQTGPAWMQQMLDWQVPPSTQNGQPNPQVPQPSTQPPTMTLPQRPVNPWAEPWPWNNFTTSSSSQAP